MIAKNWTELIGLALQVGAVVFGILKSWQWWLDFEYKKEDLKFKEAIEISNNELELAKENTLKASQVADILKSYKEAIGELEEMKAELRSKNKSNDEKVSNLVGLINKIEHMVETLAQNFTEFLMGKAK